MALTLIFTIFLSTTKAENNKLFREYIGAEFTNVKFSDVPINPDLQFDFILSFAIDYTNSASSPTPTNGKFNVFWDTKNLSPTKVSSIKSKHPNVRVGLSLGGDSIFNNPAYFQPKSINSWVSNAVSSLTHIIEHFKLDGIDIDYEHFKGDPEMFAECIGQLISILKRKGLVKYASIAPFDDQDVQNHYQTLWKKYGHVIDYVNFQFYAYDNSTTIPKFIDYFEQQMENYKGGKILTSFISDGSKGLAPTKGFFSACEMLKKRQQLFGIFVWCADESKNLGFRYEKQGQNLLASL
ncbi:chitinase 2-like [Chenopodium quinoa]|uniref:GH18 domain-containing protein n=1 Tax=Chenopodium quinoa TaxID=63459 RepID=A0A803KS50_CHEQI|nr:chitinase 2-like [Chenopodium quinoa]